MEAQIGLGADIIMAFDECTEYPTDRARVRASMELTARWAERCKNYFEAYKQEVPWASTAAELRSAGRPTTPARQKRAVWGPRRGRPSLREFRHSFTLSNSRGASAGLIF